MTTAPHLDSTKSVGRTFQSVKRLWCPQNDRLESRSHMNEEFFNTLITSVARCPNWRNVDRITCAVARDATFYGVACRGCLALRLRTLTARRGGAC